MKRFDLPAALGRLLPETERFLAELIGFPSTPGQEHDALLFLEKSFQKMDVQVERVELTNALRADPDYSSPLPGIEYDSRFNLRIARRGAGGGRTLLLNAHTDVVPPSDDMPAPWSPRVENGVMFGRGACDAKGQVATAYLIYRALETLDIRLQGDVLAHLVAEEEVGGNGTLAMVRHGEQADGCIVLEPTGGKLFTSSRGAVWFRIAFTGKAGHSGQAGVSRSALLMARDAIRILEAYHAGLLKLSRGFALFDVYPNPMPLTFGRLAAGNWPATAPSSAVLEGVLGFLPNKTREQVCEEFRTVLRQGGDDFFAAHTAVEFTYRHDASILDPQHALPQGLLQAAGRAGLPLELGGMPASNDAWFYNRQLSIPTVVYGPGELRFAHAQDEQIAMQEIADAAAAVLELLTDYCGVVT